MNTITPQQLAKQQASQPIDLIDVRTPVEFRAVHAQGAKNVPLESLDPDAFLNSRNGHSGQPLYVICRSGNRSSKACERLMKAGCADVVNVDGGTQAWEAADLPVIRGKKAISLERQVRIAAGLLVLIGAIAALTIHPYCVGLSAFVGAGLMFAGITDTCGMAMLLAKMPWNQVNSCDSNSCQTA